MNFVSFQGFGSSPTEVSPLPAAASGKLSAQSADSIDMHLHGVPGGVLRRKLVPILQRKRVIVHRSLLTRSRLPQYFNHHGALLRPLPRDVESLLKAALLGAPLALGGVEVDFQHHVPPSRSSAAQSSSMESIVVLQEALRLFPWPTIRSLVEEHVKVVSLRTGDILELPSTPAEGSSVFIVLHGTLTLVPREDAPQPAVGAYLRRRPFPPNFDPTKIPAQFPGIVEFDGPCSYGLAQALDFGPSPPATLFAGPSEHSMPSVVDIIQIHGRALQDILQQLCVVPPIADPDGPQPRLPTNDKRRSSVNRRASRFMENVSRRSSFASSELSSPRSQEREERRKTNAALKKGQTALSQLLRTRRERCTQSVFPPTQELLRFSWLFQSLPAHALVEIQKSMRAVFLPPNTRIVSTGDVHRRWYFLRRGRCVILPNVVKSGMSDSLTTSSSADIASMIHAPRTRKSTISATGAPVFLEAGSCFGELSLIFEEPQSHSIATSTACDMWCLDHAAFADVLSTDENLRLACQRRGAVLRAKWLGAQRYSDELKECLQECALFKDCWSDTLYTMVVDALEPLVLPQRTLVASASEFCDRLLIIVKGTASSQRGDVPMKFEPGSILGEASFVKHRWPFAIATTSIVDCWQLTAKKLRQIASRLDILQTIARWEPEQERLKYLTRLQEMMHGTFIPTEAMNIIRKRTTPGALPSAVIGKLPLTDAAFRRRGERRTSFSAHFRHVSMDLLEVLCVAFPESFSMNELLFRTSYGRFDDHLRKQFRRSQPVADQRASSSSDDDLAAGTEGTTGRGSGGLSLLVDTPSPVVTGGDPTPADVSAITLRNGGLGAGPADRTGRQSPSNPTKSSAMVYAKNLKLQAFERSKRKRIQRMVGEDVSSSSSGNSSGDVHTSAGSESGQDERLRQFREHKRSHRDHGVNSGVVTHVDDGSVMNRAQLDADEQVLSKIVRDQKRKERATLSSANALVLSQAMVFGPGTIDFSAPRSSRGGSESFFGVGSFASSSTVPSGLKRHSSSGSMVSDSRSLDMTDATGEHWIQKLALPKGAYQWEETLRSYFATGDEIVPALRDMLRVLRLRSKKIRQRQRNAHQAASPAATSSTQDACVLDTMFQVVPDDALHRCVHRSCPEVTVGFPEHHRLRHALAISAADRFPKIVGSSRAASTTTVTGHAAAERSGPPTGAPEESTEKTKLLLQLFRSGYAGKGAHASASSPSSVMKSVSMSPTVGDLAFDQAAPVDGKLRKGRVSVVMTSLSPAERAEGSSPPSSAAVNLGTSATDAVVKPQPAIQPHQKPSMMSSMSTSRAGDTIRMLTANSSWEGSHRSDDKRFRPLLPPDQFPSRTLYFDYLAREVKERMLAPDARVALLDAAHQRYQCEWEDPYHQGPSTTVRELFAPYVSALRSPSTRRKGACGSSPTKSWISGGDSMRSTSLRKVLHSHQNRGSPSPDLSLASSSMSDTMEERLSDKDNSTPTTPSSCSSPALSENNWTEWDGYLHGDLPAPQSSTRFELVSTQPSKGTARDKQGVAPPRRSTRQSASFMPVATSLSSLGLQDVVPYFMQDNSQVGQRIHQVPSSAGFHALQSQSQIQAKESSPMADAANDAPSGAVFESHVRDRILGDAADELRKYTASLRSGERKSELEDMYALSEDEQLFIWVDGVGLLPIGDDTLAKQDPEIAKARKVLLAAMRTSVKAATSSDDPPSDSDNNNINNNNNDTEEREMVFDIGNSFQVDVDSDLVARRRGATEGNTAKEDAAGRMQITRVIHFPDTRETIAIIRRMERISDQIGVVPGANDDPPLPPPVPSQQRILKATLEDYIAHVSADAVANAESAKQSRSGKLASRLPLVAQQQDPTSDQTRIHEIIPSFLLREGGCDFLDEALQEPASTHINPKLNATRGGDDSEDDEDDEASRERVVLVGSRMFGLTPRPLRRALSPAEGYDTRLAAVTQLTNFAAFRASDELQAKGVGDDVMDAGMSSHRSSTVASSMRSLSQSEYGGESRTQSPAFTRARRGTPSSSDSDRDPQEGDVVLRRKQLTKPPRCARSTMAVSSVADERLEASGRTPYNRVAYLRQRHARLMERVVQSSAARRSKVVPAPNAAVAAALNPLPLLPLTSNIAILVPPSPHEQQQAAHRFDRIAPNKRLATRWKNLVVPLN